MQIDIETNMKYKWICPWQIATEIIITIKYLPLANIYYDQIANQTEKLISTGKYNK